MSMFRTFHYLGEMMSKRPDSPVGRAAVRYSEGPGFVSRSPAHFSHPVTSIWCCYKFANEIFEMIKWFNKEISGACKKRSELKSCLSKGVLCNMICSPNLSFDWLIKWIKTELMNKWMSEPTNGQKSQKIITFQINL
jgi:hypothetical protein